MNLVVCPKCSARFDVSSFQPGSTFVCGSCKNLLQVPRQPVAPQRPVQRPAPQRPAPQRPAPQRPAPGRVPQRPAPGRGAGRVDPRRAGAAGAPTRAGAPPPAAPGRAGAGAGRRASRRGGGYEAPKKSNAPIIIGLGGGAAVVLIIVLLLALGGGDDPAGSAGPGGGGGPGGPAVVKRDLDPEVPEDFKQLSASKRDKECRVRFLDAEESISGHREAYEWCSARNESMWAEKSLRKILAVESENDWANEKLGKKDLRKIYDKIPADPKLDEYPNAAYEALIELQDEGKNWADSDEYAKAEKNLKEAITHKDKLNSDRLYADSYKWRQFVRHHAIYRNYKYDLEYRTPYMIFVEHADKGTTSEKAKKLVKRTADILACLYREFHKLLGEKYELPKLEDLDRPDERTMKIFMFFTRAGFDRYQKDIQQQMPQGVRAYYRPADQWITTYLGGGFESKQVKDGSDFNTNKTFHEGLHQLMHVYTKITIQKKTGEEVLWTDRRCHSRAHWFQEGVAEFFGSSKPKGDGDWELFVPYRQRLQEWKNIRKNKMAEWPLKELLGVHNQLELRRGGMELGGLAGSGHMGSLYYAQSFAFIHFLWNFENGKYRDKFLDYYKLELEGRSGIEVFAKLWWGDEKGSDLKSLDWSGLEKEWHGYTDKLWAGLNIE